MAAATASHTENTLFSHCIPPESVEAVLGRIFSLCSSSMSMTQASSLVDPVKTIFPTSYIGVLSSDSNPQLMNVLTSLKEKRTNLQPKRGYMKAFKFRSNDEIKVWTETEIEVVVMDLITSLISDDVRNTEACVDRNMMLMALGLDSMGMSEFAVQLSKVLNIQISPALVFEYPTINDILQYLNKCLLSDIEYDITRQHDSEASFHCEESPIIGVISENRYFYAVKEEGMSVQSMSMLTLCRWNSNAKTLLENGVKQLLSLNPILTGYIEKGTHAVTGQTGLCVVPSQYALDSIFHVVNEADGDCTHGHTANTDIDNRFLADCDLKDMMQAVSSVCGPLVPELGNGWDQKRYKSRLFAVTVVNLRRKDHSGDEGEEYAVVHIAMSHAIGDGYTYYKLIDQLNQLMKRGQITTPLRWNEPVILIDSRVHVSGKSKALVNWSSEVEHISNCWNFTVLDGSAAEDTKNSNSLNDNDSKVVQFSSDVIISSVISRLTLSSVCVAIHTRNLDAGLTSDLAGDFSIAVALEVDPSESVSLYKEVCKLIGTSNEIVSRKMLSRGDTIVSDLTSITHLVDIPTIGFELLCQVPYHRTKISFGQVLIFKAYATNIASANLDINDTF